MQRALEKQEAVGRPGQPSLLVVKEKMGLPHARELVDRPLLNGAQEAGDAIALTCCHFLVCFKTLGLCMQGHQSCPGSPMLTGPMKAHCCVI